MSQPPFVTKSMKRKLMRESGTACPLCACTMWHPDWGTQGPDSRRATVDHIRPQSKGGGHSKKNLRVICRHCNAKRGNMLLGQRRVRPAASRLQYQ